MRKTKHVATLSVALMAAVAGDLMIQATERRTDALVLGHAFAELVVAEGTGTDPDEVAAAALKQDARLGPYAAWRQREADYREAVAREIRRRHDDQVAYSAPSLR